MIHISDSLEIISSFKQDSYNDEQNHESSKTRLQSQQIGFTREQYQTLLALLQQFKSNDNVSNQFFVIPSNMITQNGNKFLLSFSFWILDSGY